MIRALSIVLVLVVLGAIGAWLADRPGTVTLVWQGWRIDTSIGVLAFGALLVAIVAAALYRLWQIAIRAPRRFREARAGRQRERGYRALSQGMVAVAAGDAAEAGRFARRADALLDDPPLTLLLSAQAAQLGGDEDAARRYFTAMLDRPETTFLGLRGLLMQAERARDKPAALDYAERAYALRPRSGWVLASLYALQAGEGKWRAALKTIDEAIRTRAVAETEAARHKAAILLALADEEAASGAMQPAIEHARAARATDPRAAAPALRLVRLYVETSQPRHAARAIYDAWKTTPHPALVQHYAALEKGAAPLEMFKRLERLAAHNPDHPETHLMMAEAAIAARLWGAARRHLEAVSAETGDERHARAMAALEEAERHDSAAAQSWLRRAAVAAPAPGWVCGACGAEAADWRPHCGRCGTLASVDWRRPRVNARMPLAPPHTATDPPRHG